MSEPASKMVFTDEPISFTRRLMALRGVPPQEYPRLAEESSRALSPQLVTAHVPDCPRAEALRELRSQLVLRWFAECRTLAVLAPRSEDGCSVVAANLAIAFSQLDQPTLLIDANFRDSQQHKLFGLSPTVGLADLLRNPDVYDEALISVPGFENLRVLCTGVIPVNPQELVTRTSFTYLMKTVPAHFKAIIIDTPPALSYADAQIIAARARGCLLVTRRHRTRLREVALVKSQLEPSAAVLLGAVINE
jgi:chain length determinant protein tyrosine kinase EpsG